MDDYENEKFNADYLDDSTKASRDVDYSNIDRYMDDGNATSTITLSDAANQKSEVDTEQYGVRKPTRKIIRGKLIHD